MKRQFTLLGLTILWASLAGAARYPLFGGPGLIHLQSAKTGIGYGGRSLAALSFYSEQNYYGLSGNQDAFLDAWSYNTLYYVPVKNLAVMAAGIAHAEQWTVAAPDTSRPTDQSLACPGDAVVAVKYCLPLLEGKMDLGFMPTLSVPMDKEQYQDGPSQTGKLDFGAKLLTDINLGRTTVFINAGFLSRGEERPQLPFGAGAEYSFKGNLSAFMEISGEYRLGAQKDSLTDDQILRGRGADRTELRITPGVRYSPLPFLGLNLACDIGLSRATAPWQLVLGFDFPARAGKALSGPIGGAVAGWIKDRETGVPMKGMITFPGSNLPGLVSNEAGDYEAKLPPGEYKVHIYANGYRWLERKINVKEGKVEKWDLTLKRKTAGFKGKVIDRVTGQPLPAAVSFNSSRAGDIGSDSVTGQFGTVVPPGKYKISVSLEGYRSFEEELTLKDKSDTERQILLEREIAAATLPPAPASEKRTKEPDALSPVPVAYQPSAASAPAAPAAEKPKTAAPPVPTPRPGSTQAPAVPAAAKPAKMSAEEVTALYKKGVQHFMNEEYAVAEKIFKQVLSADPRHAKAKEYLGKTKDRLKK
ncbi:PEGA domain-containing protein [candidate division TA06 bacterium]|uniref:PEGA domain-containing protein n=1 Tax=candidate division TA06 bacterium TaxID=2250710 RepID=A0A933I991_UNCT6|nr:PEGA domain-containing protein [candidate division TA06 bacterium]